MKKQKKSVNERYEDRMVSNTADGPWLAVTIIRYILQVQILVLLGIASVWPLVHIW